jgi:hypothetical protein
MHFDLTDELAILADLYATHGDAQQNTIEGACWAFSRLTGGDAIQMYADVKAAAAPIPVVPSAVSPLMQAAATAEPVPVEALGEYPGIGPIISTAAPLVEADLSRPPAAPSGNSMAEQFERAQAAGDPLVAPIDPQTLAEIEAELSSAQHPSTGIPLK